MRVLVTGGAGYIGSHVAKSLAAGGHEPVVYDNLSAGHWWAVRWGPLLVGDLADGRLLRYALLEYRIEAVIHLAAYAYVGESMHKPGKYFHNNVTNTFCLLDAMTDIGVEQIVFSSSCATYGQPQELPLTERHPQVPVNPYGESKFMSERAIRWYGEAHGLRWCALRYFNAAGADPDGQIGEDHDPETHLIPSVIEAALGSRRQVDVYGIDYPTRDGTAIRDFVHVADLADAHVLALDYLADGGDNLALNLGTGWGSTVRETIEAVERISGRAVPVAERPRRPGDPPVLVADANRARQVLGWTPRRSALDDIVATAWSWHSTRSASDLASSRVPLAIK